MEDNLKEMMGVSSSAGLGVNQDGTPYNAGGNPTDKFGEPPVFRNTNILKRNVKLVNSLLPNTSKKKKKPLRGILGMKTMGMP